MKKIIALLLCFVLVMPMAAVSAQESTANLQNLMKDLKIMQGDEAGNFNLGALVTRAEFAKIAVAASEYRNSVSGVSFTSPFHDVPFTYWGASYIRCAANNGYIKGYPDSTFRPEENVTLEEGVTIVLKLLGYKDDYFDMSWPDGQMKAAVDFELLTGVSAALGQPLTRGDVMQLIYNALTTNMKDKQSALLNSFGYSYTEDVILIATSNEDSSISGNKILTSAGTFEIQSGFDKSLAGYKGDMVTKNTGAVVSFIPTNKRGASYTLNTVLKDDVLVYNGDKTLSVNIGKNTPIYYKTEKSSMDGLKSKASIGDSVTVYTNQAGDTEYVMVGGIKSAGAVTVLADASSYGINENTVVYRNGKQVSKSEIQTRDILYYSKDMNIAWVWSNKITGVYENATPNRDNIETVTISGKSYSIETATAYEKFVTGGELNLGDTVTISLGRNGEIADVFKASGEDASLMGYLVATGTKQYEDQLGNSYSSYYATVAFADGREVEYKTEIDYQNYKCSLVNVSFDGSGTKIRKMATGNNTLSGDFDAEGNTLGTAKLANDVKIMDIAQTEASKSASYITVYKQRLDDAYLNAKQILAFERNEKGEISSLYLNNATGDCYDFGIVTNIRGSSYSVDAGGKSLSAGGGTTYSVSEGSAVKILLSGNSVSAMQKLSSVPENFKSATDTSLIFGNTEYKVYDKIAVYERVAVGQWHSITYADFLSGDKPKSVQAYFDKTEQNGGRIRVLVITR